MKLLGSLLFASAVKADGMMMPEDTPDVAELEDLFFETTATPTSMPMEHTTGKHMEIITNAERGHHEEPHGKPCISCGCYAEEMAQWKESMRIWKADYQGKCMCNEVKGLNESYMTANHFCYMNVKASTCSLLFITKRSLSQS